MRALLVVAVLGIAFCLPEHAGAKNANHCALKVYTTISVTMPDDATVLVPVTIGDHAVFMRLNLASLEGFISKSAVDTLGLQYHAGGQSSRVQYGGHPFAGETTLAGFSIGNLKFGQSTFSVPEPTAYGEQSYAGLPIIGLLGIDLFAHADVEIDLSHGRMTLYSQDHCPGRVVYWAADYSVIPMDQDDVGTLYFPVELDGQLINATLSTAHPFSVLRTDASKALYGFDEHSPTVKTRTGASGGDPTHFQAMSLTAKGLTVMNADIELRHADCGFRRSTRNGAAGYEKCLGLFPLDLGLNVLKKLHLYLATKERKLYFTAATADPKPAAQEVP